MSKARLVITAVIVEGRTQADVARDYNLSPSWVSKLVARYHRDGDTAFEPRSRRPVTSPRTTNDATVELVLELRSRLSGQGLDAGPDTIGWHLTHHHHIHVSRATIYRILRHAGTITAQPSKRPKSSYIRFQADQPNETWQSDFTHYRLANRVDIEIITWLDDHSRHALHVSCHLRITGHIVLDTFQRACTEFGPPAATLTDNGMVYTARYAGGRGGRNTFEHELATLGITQKNSRPNHPTTCGKVERFQQTMKKWLRAQPHQPATLTQLQTLLELFIDEYNHRRPHRSLPHHQTPHTAYTTRPKAHPDNTIDNSNYRVRHDRIDKSGVVTLRHNSRLHHIGIGRTHAQTNIIMLIDNLNIRIINAATGEILRALTLNPHTDYQPTGAPKGPTRPKPKRSEPPS